jgi:hypothetical protein
MDTFSGRCRSLLKSFSPMLSLERLDLSAVSITNIAESHFPVFSKTLPK